MGTIFISYNHKDTDYAHKLAIALETEGFKVWIDEVIEYGSEWPTTIQEHLDKCDLLIVIMTPNSYESKWVQNELNRAMRKNKPIFPLLLEGNEPWLSVESIQYTDVRGEKLPPVKFYQLLSRSTHRSKVTATAQPISSNNKQPDTHRVNPWVLSAIGLLLIGIVVLSLARAGNRNDLPIITASPSVLPTFTTSPPSSESTPTIADTLIPTEPLLPTETPFPAEITDSRGIAMVFVPSGEFTMGVDNPNTNNNLSNIVTLEAYYIDKFEVTNVLYRECVSAGVCLPPKYEYSATRARYFNESQFDTSPVVFVDWDEAQAYCAWRGDRLPTEAEWEKAARGTDDRLYPWGNAFSCRDGNFDDETQLDSFIVKGGPNCDGYVDTAPVGAFTGGASSYGALDMAGNVWEWTSSLFMPYPYTSADGREDFNRDGMRVMRGGSYLNTESSLTAAYREKNDPLNALGSIGFRCAVSIEP